MFGRHTLYHDLASSPLSLALPVQISIRTRYSHPIFAPTMSGIPRHELHYYLPSNASQIQEQQQGAKRLQIDWACCGEKCKQRIHNDVHKESSCMVCRHKLADCNECLKNRLYDHNAIPELPSPTFSSSNAGFAGTAASIAARQAAKAAERWEVEEAMRREKRTTEVGRRDIEEKWNKRKRRAKCVIL